jgi:esterase/lipase superfamily enzyme
MNHREYHRWLSPSLGRDMELLAYGHGGARVIVFPTSMGRFYEWEDRGMISALDEHIRNGWLQIFCVDSVDEESWYARYKHPSARAWRHIQYDAYIRDEVLPLTQARNANPFLITAGTSFGAYHAANFGFRYPYVVNRVVALSGLYDIKKMTDGYSDDNVYYNDPSHFILHEHDQGRLDALRRMNIILAVGRDDPSYANNEHLSRALSGKGIWNSLQVWDGWVHDWPWWREMIVRYIGGT